MTGIRKKNRRNVQKKIADTAKGFGGGQTKKERKRKTIKEKEKRFANSTRCSQAVTHPSTNRAQTLLNFGDRTRSGAFNVVWPLATDSENYTLINFQCTYTVTLKENSSRERENSNSKTVFYKD